MNVKKILAAVALGAALFGSVSAYAATASSDEAALQQQQIRASGVVVDVQGRPIPGASVIVKGTLNGTMTDSQGRFAITTNPGATLEISCVGYATKSVVANEGVRVVLSDDAEFLNEVVVVGYGAQKKENLTGAVASVNVEKALEGRPIPDVARGLQGMAPGLNVRVGSAEVGSDAIIRIRGQVGSLNGSASPLILLDNVEIPSLNLVNPDDVESVSVLKDAASASIYGAKAAFGVILITTKKGNKEADRVNVTYSGNMAFQSMAKNYEMADVESLHYWVESAEREGKFKPVGAFWLIDRDGYEAAKAWKEKYGKTLQDSPMTYGRDWYINDSGAKIGVRTYDPYYYNVRKYAPAQTHNISVAGNKGRTDYNISLGYLDQHGLMKNTNFDYFDRYNANVRVKTQINDWLNVHSGLMMTNSTKSWAFSTSSTTADQWYYLFRWASNYPLISVDENGNNVRTMAYETSVAHQAKTKTLYSSINVGTTITPVKNWNINVDYTYANNNSQTFEPGIRYMAGNTWADPMPLTKNGSTYTIANEWNDYNGLGSQITAYGLQVQDYTATYDSIYQDSYTSQRQTWNITSTYDLKLTDHLFNFMLGANIVSYDYTGVWGKKMTLINIDNPQFDLATGTMTSGGSASWNSTAGFFGRVNYNYKERYLLEANLRYDGSSKFPAALQWRWFPSVSAGWRVTEEPWMLPYKNVLSALKLRASWGMIGDQTVPSSLYIPTMAAITDYWIHNSAKDNAFATPGMVVGDITWQDIITLDFGVDFSLFNQINVTFDWYQRDTKNMIVPMEGLSYNIGTTAPSGNYGDLRTRGWELEVGYGKTFSNGLSVSATATLADAKTKITHYGNNANGINGWYDGKTYGEIWGYRVDRLFQNEDFAYDASGNLITLTDKYGSYYQYADGKDYATQGKISSGNLISGPGDVKFKDLDGNGIIDNGDQLIGYYNKDNTDDESKWGKPRYGDLDVIGNTTPRYEYGFRLDLDYKGVDFSLFLQGIGKRNMIGSSWTTIPGYSSGDGGMAATFANDFWYETKDDKGNVIDSNYDAFYPKAANLNRTNTFNMVNSDRYMLNMAYLRVKNITLGYTLPRNLTRKISMQKARVYVSLENFFTFDKLRGLPLDPEEITGYSSFNSSNYNSSFAGIGTPAYKSASFGVQVTF